MALRRIEQVDALTGEILEGAVLAIQRPKQTNGFQKGKWVAMEQTAQETLATNPRLTLQAHRVLAMLIAHADYGNWLPINQAATARNMNMQPTHFSRALRILVEEGIVLKGPGPDCGMRQHYRLNPEFGWKGSAKSHREALSTRPKKPDLRVV